jgi:hypothetical protein
MDKDLRAFARKSVDQQIGVWERMVIEALLQVHNASPSARAYARATLIEVLDSADQDERYAAERVTRSGR